MNLHAEVAEEEKLFREVSKVGLMVYSMMTDEEEDQSITIQARGKIWRITVEEQSITRHRRGGKTHGKKK
jgi:hypothetical protein